MIADRFDSRTLANMEVALERACRSVVRRGTRRTPHIASKILQCAQGGNVTLKALTDRGERIVADTWSLTVIRLTSTNQHEQLARHVR